MSNEENGKNQSTLIHVEKPATAIEACELSELDADEIAGGTGVNENCVNIYKCC